jgi:hypothetical protein
MLTLIFIYIYVLYKLKITECINNYLFKYFLLFLWYLFIWLVFFLFKNLYICCNRLEVI